MRWGVKKIEEGFLVVVDPDGGVVVQYGGGIGFFIFFGTFDEGINAADLQSINGAPPKPCRNYKISCELLNIVVEPLVVAVV